MANNTLTLFSPGTAKISWKVKMGDEELTSVDSLVLNINDKKLDITEQYENKSVNLEVSKDTTFYLDASSDDYEVRSGKLNLNFINGGVYYGTLNIPTSDIDKDGWSVVKKELTNYINSLTDEDLLKGLVDENPIDSTGKIIANPGKLVKGTPTQDNIFTTKYFYCADENVDESRPVLIYPAEQGRLSTIIDAMGNHMYNAKTSSNDNENGFMMEKITIGGKVEHYVYLQKAPVANDAELDALYYTFNK